VGSLGNLIRLLVGQQGAPRQQSPRHAEAARLLLSREQNPGKPSVAPTAAALASKSTVLGSVVAESNPSQTILGSFV